MSSEQNAESAGVEQPKEESEQEIPITADGKITKRIIKQGFGPKPRRGQKVTVHYTGTFLDGTKFDSSVDKGRPFLFQIGKGVITGWNLALLSMKVGEKAVFTMSHEYAYGEEGAPPTIPPKATLRFEIEFIKTSSK